MPLRRKFTTAELKRQVDLPLLLAGMENHTEKELLDMPMSDRHYVPTGLVRDVQPDEAFETSLREHGFKATDNITLVPILTADEQKEYAQDPKALDAAMHTLEWMQDKDRKFFVADGANRTTLSKKYDLEPFALFLHPSIPFETLSYLAIANNEGITINTLPVVTRMFYVVCRIIRDCQLHRLHQQTPHSWALDERRYEPKEDVNFGRGLGW
jgi:hypothetical protein